MQPCSCACVRMCMYVCLASLCTLTVLYIKFLTNKMTSNILRITEVILVESDETRTMMCLYTIIIIEQYSKKHIAVTAICMSILSRTHLIATAPTFHIYVFGPLVFLSLLSRSRFLYLYLCI